MQKIKNFIGTIQEQPERTRKTILVITSFSLTAILIIIWVSTLTARLSKDNAQNFKSDTQSPFSLIAGILEKSYASAINGYNSTK